MDSFDKQTLTSLCEAGFGSRVVDHFTIHTTRDSQTDRESMTVSLLLFVLEQLGLAPIPHQVFVSLGVVIPCIFL